MLPDEVSVGCINRPQAPFTEEAIDVCASTSKIESLPIPCTGYDRKYVLDCTRSSIQLKEFPLHRRAVSQGGHTNIYTSIIDDWRTINEVIRWGSQLSAPDDCSGCGVKGIESNITTTDKVYQGRSPINGD